MDAECFARHHSGASPGVEGWASLFERGSTSVRANKSSALGNKMLPLSSISLHSSSDSTHRTVSLISPATIQIISRASESFRSFGVDQVSSSLRSTYCAESRLAWSAFESVSRISVKRCCRSRKVSSGNGDFKMNVDCPACSFGWCGFDRGATRFLISLAVTAVPFANSFATLPNILNRPSSSRAITAR